VSDSTPPPAERDLVQAAYAAPAVSLKVEGARGDGDPERRAARLAGAFLAFTALTGLVMNVLRIVRPSSLRASGLPLAAIIATLLPTFLLLVIDTLLAIPLLSGSRRFRGLTFVRAALFLVGPFVLFLLLPKGMQRLAVAWPWMLARGSLFSLVFLLLLAGQPRRARLSAAIACMAIFLAGDAAELWELLWRR
jgi:hypothetical protein